MGSNIHTKGEPVIYPSHPCLVLKPYTTSEQSIEVMTVHIHTLVIMYKQKTLIKTNNVS